MSERDRIKLVRYLTSRGRSEFISVAIFLFVVFLDRISKLFFTHILSVGESIPVVKNFFHFTLVYNTGIAFGLFKNRGMLFIIIPIVVILLILLNLLMHRNHRGLERIHMIASALIISGAVGNLIDRIFFGHVIDFIDLRVWPVFNVADSAITIGTAILLFKCIPSFAK